jgi:hypothetical protein
VSPKGHKYLRVSGEVYGKLREIARSKGLVSAADAIPLLLEYEDIHSKLEHTLQTRISEIKELIQAGCRPPAEPGTGEGREQHAGRPITESLRSILNWVKKKIGLAG